MGPSNLKRVGGVTAVPTLGAAAERACWWVRRKRWGDWNLARGVRPAGEEHDCVLPSSPGWLASFEGNETWRDPFLLFSRRVRERAAADTGSWGGKETDEEGERRRAEQMSRGFQQVFGTGGRGSMVVFHTPAIVKRKLTWNPINNKKFEALSYLPPLSEESIAKEVHYMISKGWIPCLEFDEVGQVHRTNARIPGYYDGRYWTLWKLPLFGCTDSSQVLDEIRQCKEAYPNVYIRLLAFDNKRKCQCMSFVVQKPSNHP